MKTSQKGIDLIKQFEGCRLVAYKCPAGIWTIGYGHTQGVKAGDKITRSKAESFLRSDLKKFEKGILNSVKVPLNQYQFDALISFTYNCGLGAFKSSTLLKKLNAGDYKGAGAEFLKWNKSNGRVLAGLKRRRKAEKVLFDKIPVQTVYTVQKGDTLSKIAKQHKTTVRKIANLNNLKSPDIIYIGQKLKLK